MKTPPETFERLHKVFSAAHPASVLYFADRSVCSTVEILDLLDDLEDAMDERDQLRAENEALRAFVHDVATLTEDARESVLEELTNWDHADVYRSLARIVTDAARLDALRKEGT